MEDRAIMFVFTRQGITNADLPQPAASGSGQGSSEQDTSKNGKVCSNGSGKRAPPDKAVDESDTESRSKKPNILLTLDRAFIEKIKNYKKAPVIKPRVCLHHIPDYVLTEVMKNDARDLVFRVLLLAL